ncbi:hypothetical protein ACE1CD_01160 [Aerosakkonema sp. BLCC-F183]|uniref:hypothetical protein n=1 Tax=Aerosakkonema sp. BLCC-F183 TaxID=3342834 RepID=UPI0035B8B684
MNDFLSGFLQGVGKKIGERVAGEKNQDPHEDWENYGYHTIYGITPKIFTLGGHYSDRFVRIGDDIYYIDSGELRISIRTPTYRTCVSIPPGKWHSGIVQEIVNNLHSYDKEFFCRGYSFPDFLKKKIEKH